MKKIKFLLLPIVGLLSFSCFSYSSDDDLSFVSVFSGYATTDQLNSQTFEPKMYTLPSGFDPSGYSGICAYFEYSFSRQLLSTPSKNNAWGSSMPHVEYWSDGTMLGQNFLARKPNQNGVVDGIFKQMHCFEFDIELATLPFSVYVVNPLSSGIGNIDYFFYDYKFFKSGSSSSSSDCSQDCSQDSNYLQCLESLNTANGTISSLSGSLASCQSSLSSCQGGQDAAYLQCLEDKESCQTALNSLSGQYLSCVNYNSSLSDQLNECLQNSNGSGNDLICNSFSLNRYNGNDTYSSQIHNDLRLPRGYKGYLDEGVLGIKNIYDPDYAYSMDGEEFEKVVNSYGILFLFLFSGGLFVLFLYVIRKYFTSLFK